MKKTSIILIILSAFLAFTFSSCKDDDGDGIPDILNTKLTMKINGTEWKSMFRQTNLAVKDNFKVFTILATNGVSKTEGSSILITIRGDEEKSYDLSTTIVGGALECEIVYKESYSASTDDAFVGSSGTVTLTEIDTENKKISGTFEFTVHRSSNVQETLTITDGQFQDLRYTNVSAR